MASNIDTKLRTAIIKPGERIILPQDAVIQSLVIDGSIDVTSSCDNLPTPSSYRCGYFHLMLDNDNNDGHPMDERETYYLSLKVGNNLYNINRKVISVGDNPGTMNSPAVLNTHVPDQSLFSFTRIQGDQVGHRQAIYVYFKTIDSLFSTVELALTNYGSIAYYKGNIVDCNMFEFGVDSSIKDDIMGPTT